jgi:hypothetical protein
MRISSDVLMGLLNHVHITQLPKIVFLSMVLKVPEVKSPSVNNPRFCVATTERRITF